MSDSENHKQYYEEIFSQGTEEQWERAPGKNVILNALQYYLKIGVCPKNADIVDMGCGSGFFLNEIRSEVPDNEFHLYGVDFSSKAIEKAKKQYPSIQFFCEDGSNTHFGEEEFNVLISYGTYEHFQNPEMGIHEAVRILRGGGLFFCMIPTLGIDRTDRNDEGWYEERQVQGSPIRQMQWNLKRQTWNQFFLQANLILFPMETSATFGALKPGVFFFGKKGIY